MCGIAGIIQRRDRSYNLSQLQQMTRALAHRGPDGEGHWQSPSGQVLLGHRRLAIIDLTEAAAQPMVRNYQDSLSITYNGEIYNYLELRSILQKEGYSFTTQSDTEVILAAYDFYGEDCVLHFDGMFAFAIWNEAEQELFAARDRFGEKPFFYTTDNRGCLFASEMKALWAAGLSRQPNLQLMFNYITIGYVDNPEQPEETFYTNIFKLPAACRLYYTPDNGELYVEKYWDIDPQLQQKKITEFDALDEFKYLFEQSVKRRLRSDVPVGTSLSGGLDSSSVLSTILQNSATVPHSFSAVFPGFEKNEAAYIQQLTDAWQVPGHTVAPTAADMINHWQKIIYHQEEPFGSSGIVAQYKVFELAARQQTKVLLDGQGADEVLAGYQHHYKWYWQELFVKRKLLISGELKAARKLGVQESFGFRNIIAALFPDIASAIVEKRYLLSALQQKDLTPDFVHLQSREAYYSTPPFFNLNGALYFNTCMHGLEELLRYADRNSMAHGREIRLPFLNHELVSFVFSLPPSFKIQKGYTKWLLRKTMEKQLPENICWRKDKVGFEPPQKNWMQDPVVTDMIHEAKTRLVAEKILNPGVLQQKPAAQNAYEANNFNWRYLTAAPFI
jgi:asparagine synthase (glutamine-hydrolysing)